MKAIYGGNAKNDRVDSYKIVQLIRVGNFPLAYVYPTDMRSVFINFIVEYIILVLTLF